MATLNNPIIQAGVPSHKQYTITATATQVGGSSILNNPSVCRLLTVKNADGAANACYIGPSTVANTPALAGVELGAGDSITYEDVAPNELYIVGTANAANIAFFEAQY